MSVLRTLLADRGHVIEIGSGTGQHAVHFATALPWLIWQSSDRADYLPGIRAWIDDAALKNTPFPIEFDVSGTWPTAKFDAVFSANTLHIMAWHEVERLFAGLPEITTDDAIVIIYGPFNNDGRYSSDSNAAFDLQLKARGAHMAIRDAQAIDALADAVGLELIDDISMPANNRCRVWRRRAR